jgi:hypothetical protein
MRATGRRRQAVVCVVVALLATGGILTTATSANPGTRTAVVSEFPHTTRLSAGSVPAAAIPAPVATTTTVPAAPPPAAPTAAPTPPATPAVAVDPPGYGCAAALAYLAANANPEFTVECPGYADGNEAMTCVNHAPECAGEHLIAIADPCPAAYMNEAYNSNSWSDAEGTFTRPIDPYGEC